MIFIEDTYFTRECFTEGSSYYITNNKTNTKIYRKRKKNNMLNKLLIDN